VIARAEHEMSPGHDSPGRILRQPGGVALNVARALAGAGVAPVLLSALGSDREGELLMKEIIGFGIDGSHVARVPDPTDTYVAIEQKDGELFAAVADCYSLEYAGEDVIKPLLEGALGKPFDGIAMIDGNLPDRILSVVASDTGPLASASRIFVFDDSRSAATAIAAAGASSIITDGPNPATIAYDGTVLSVTPPSVEVKTVTGAGDVFLAGYLAAELRGEHPAQALIAAADAAAHHVAGHPAKKLGAR